MVAGEVGESNDKPGGLLVELSIGNYWPSDAGIHHSRYAAVDSCSGSCVGSCLWRWRCNYLCSCPLASERFHRLVCKKDFLLNRPVYSPRRYASRFHFFGSAADSDAVQIVLYFTASGVIPMHAWTWIAFFVEAFAYIGQTRGKDILCVF